MDKNSIINILTQAKPIYDAMYPVIIEYCKVEESIMQKEELKNQILGVGHLIVSLMLSSSLIFPGVIYYKCIKKYRNNKIDAEIAVLKNKILQLSSMLQTYIEAIRQTGIQDILPEQYLNPVEHSVKYILGYLETGRADNLKEAMNLFEEEKHRINMEYMQNETLQQTRINGQMLFWGNMINATNAINNLRK